MLIFAIGFNLWLYRLEPTATIDPNDNAFQYALVDRTNQIWDFASKKCSINVLCFTSYLVDHWVPNWAEGYNLPFYYSHVPQIIIVASWRFFNQISLFSYYHWIIYLLLSLFPLSVFISLRVIKLPWLAAGLGALLASHISTDGLYGLDPPSFLWRGYGLSSQLFAMVFLPLALAYAWRYFNQKTNFWPAVFFLTMTAVGHLGLGIMAMLSLIPLAIARPSKQTVLKFLFLGGTVIFFLSYWITPIFLNDNYHNISFWDPPWKFASYGAKETIVRLLNGDLFDWGRGPWMTTLVIVGLIAASYVLRPTSYVSFSLLFLFWLLMYFGRTTWGPLIDLIPGMKEFHLSRFVVGVHVAGLFLMPIGIEAMVSRVTYHVSRIKPFVYLFIGLLVYWIIYPQTISYSKHNDRLIKQANENHAKVKNDEEALFTALRKAQGDAPGRVFAGRGGWWGKDFKVAETPYYMQLSTFGIPTVLWLPETWSPNSDVEQYFSEDKAKDYDLFGIRYVATPPKQETQKFWKLIAEKPTWKLYEVEKTVIPAKAGIQPSSSQIRDPRLRGDDNVGSGDDNKSVGYFTSGVRPAIVATDKRSYGNVVRLWIQSDAHVKGLYPELTFAKDYPKKTGLPNFKMIDEVTYVVPDGTKHNLFQEPPWYQNTTPAEQDLAPRDNKPIILSEENNTDMVFKTKVEVGENCQECIVVLKQSFHPNWRATIDGKPAPTFTVFPFYLAVSVPSGPPARFAARRAGEAGTHEIVFSYQPSRLKIALLLLELAVLVSLIILAIRSRFLIRSFSTKP